MMKLKPRLKTKRKGYIVFTCASLAFLAVFGIGFSSWIVVTSIDNTAAVQAAAIVQPSIFSDVSITTFKLGQDGVVKDGIIRSSGDVTVSLKIHNEYCVEYGFLNYETNIFSMRATLECQNANFLSLGSMTDLSGISDPSSYNKETVDSNTSLSYELSFPINIETDLTSLTITYTFTETSGNKLESYFSSIPNITFKAEAITNAPIEE